MLRWYSPFLWPACLLSTLLAGAGGASADDLKHALTVYGGFTVFNRPDADSLILVEFPFSLNRHEFDFYCPDSALPEVQARVYAQVTMYGVDGLPVDSASTYFGVKAADMTEAKQKGLKLLNSVALARPAGVYSARLTIIDAVSKREGEAFYDQLVVEPAVSNRLSVGGLCLAYGVDYVGDSLKVPSNQVPKNGFNVRCNPLGLFSTEDTVMYVYGELYNLLYTAGTASQYRLSYAATTRAGIVQQHFGVTVRPKTGNTAVLSDQFDITGLPAGYYELLVVATDLANDAVDSQKVGFTIMAPMTDEALAGLSAEKFDPYDTLRLADQMNLVYHLLDPVERKDLEHLTDDGKATFLTRYWQQRDSDPTTPENEDRLRMIERYAYCNRFFSTEEDKKDGWRTDRGRIFMKYGLYDDMDDIQHPLEGHPYQVWHYYGVEEGVVFVFEDREGYGFYRLVHSDARGEIYSSSWANRLKTDDTYRMD